MQVLDLWMVGEESCRRLIDEARGGADLVLIEGVMGLYDGTPSSADLARAFDLPVLAVIDVSAMAQSVGAVAMGLRDFGPVRLAGVIANGIASEGHAALVSAALRDVPLVASLPRLPVSLPERHLGLVAPADSADVEAQLDPSAARSESTRARGLRRRASSSPRSRPGRRPRGLPPRTRLLSRGAWWRSRTMRPSPFCIPPIVACLESLGARLRFFSPLADEPVPPEAPCGILAGRLSRTARRPAVPGPPVPCLDPRGPRGATFRSSPNAAA